MPDPAAVLAIAVTANTAQANAALANTQRQLKGTQTTAMASSAKIGKALGGVALAAGAAAVGLAKIGEEFDNAYDKISVRTGKTGKGLDRLKDSFRAVVTTVPTDFDSAAEAVAGLDQRLGASGKTLTRLGRQMTALSKITETDVEDNVRSVSRAFVDWEVKTKDQSRTLDGFFRLSQNTGVAVADIAESVQKFGSPLRQLGFDLDTAAAMFANFEKAGVNTQTMVPGLKLALANLNDPIGEAEKQIKKFNVTIGNSPKGLREVFKILGDDSVKAVDRISLAMAVFGRRAGADMKEAIEQGRFEVDKLLRVMKSGDETILDAERRTRDFSEQWQLFKNRVMVGLEPVATAVFKALSDGMGGLNRLMKGKGGFAESIKSIAGAFRDFWNNSAIFREAMNVVWSITKRAWAGIKDIFRGGAQVIRGVVKVISGVLTLRFDRAWDGVKDIFSGAATAIKGIMRAMTAPIREIASRIGKVMLGAFRGAAEGIAKVFTWLKDKVLGIFIDLKNAIGDALGWIEGAVNDALVELGIKDRISIKAPAGPRGPAGPGSPGSHPAGPGGPIGRQLGGHIPGPSRGDTVPLMAEGGEFMVNSRATRKFRPLLEAINSGVPRFASGGMVGLKPGIARLAKYAMDRYGLAISSGLRPGTGSFHNTGEAVDLVPPSMGATKGIFSAFKNQLEELFYDPWGGWDSGQMIGPIGGHMDHIHAAILGGGAGGPSMLKRIGRVMFTGSGPLSKIGQGSIDRVRAAANRFLRKKSAMGFHGATGGTMTLGDIANLWSSVNGGLGDANLMARIAMAESSGVPTAIGNDPGGTTGYGLWQITSGFHDDLIARFGGPQGILNPVNNAKAAAIILRNEGLGAWDASRANWQLGGMVPWFGKGADFIANTPMLMGVGDGGPERVSVMPLAGGGGWDGGYGEVYVEPPQVHVYVSGEGINWDEVTHEIEDSVNEAFSHQNQLGRMR